MTDQDVTQERLDYWHGEALRLTDERDQAVAERDRYRDALEFYADPETYFAVGFIADSLAGAFVDDVSDVTHPDGGPDRKPGKRARAALAVSTP